MPRGMDSIERVSAAFSDNNKSDVPNEQLFWTLTLVDYWTALVFVLVIQSEVVKMSNQDRSLLVTVGTTEFNELIKAIDNHEFAIALQILSINKVTVQIGRGNHEPHTLIESCKSFGIEVELCRFKPDLEIDMRLADLIISHCGAGSILEAVKYKKPLIVVVNESLQDNHQTELSDALSNSGYCMSAFPKTLLQTLSSEFSRTSEGVQRRTQTDLIKHIPINDSTLFCKALDSMYDFSS